MIRLLRRLFAIVAFVGVFAWLLAGAIDQELASGGVLNERGGAGTGATSKPRVAEGQGEPRPLAPLSLSACGASSIGPDGRVTVTSCGERLSERESRPRPGEYPAGADGPRVAISSSASRSESLYQGRPIRWWARRAVQARKDANARGLTIRRLQTTARRQLAYPTGHWLDGAFLCIHRYERGADRWATNTGNGYRGGLQFDSSFARTYGPKWARKAFGESAHLWPASVQIAAAIRAWTTRGFGPWPSTRRMCGL